MRSPIVAAAAAALALSALPATAGGKGVKKPKG